MSEPDLIQQLADRIESNRKEIKEGLGEKKDQFFEMVKSFVARMDPAKAALYIGLAYLGYERLPLLKSDIAKMLWGPVAMELATAPAGDTSFGVKILGTGVEIPVNAQIAGLSMLATLGFACLPWENLDAAIRDQSDKNVEGVTSYNEALTLYGSVMTEEEKATLNDLWLNVVLTRHRRTDLTQALNSLIGYIKGMVPTWKGRLEGDG